MLQYDSGGEHVLTTLTCPRLRGHAGYRKILKWTLRIAKPVNHKTTKGMHRGCTLPDVFMLLQASLAVETTNMSVDD